MTFNNKTVLITGGARGFGKAIAVAFLESGAETIVIDSNENNIEDFRKKYNENNSKVKLITMDITKSKSTVNILNSLCDSYKGIDILINNARSGIRTNPLEESEDNFDTTVAVMLKAPLFMSQYLIKKNYKINKNQSTTIINISSILGQYVSNESASYHLVKSAFEGLTKYLAFHGGKFNARVNSISPAFIVPEENVDFYNSDDNEKFRDLVSSYHPLGKIGELKDLTECVFFLSSEKSKFINGTTIDLNGGVNLEYSINNLIRSINESKS
jgi:NAD(P)-dependent dehydrogenase (short-subunit alcohol dehydrogenase family)